MTKTAFATRKIGQPRMMASNQVCKQFALRPQFLRRPDGTRRRVVYALRSRLFEMRACALESAAIADVVLKGGAIFPKIMPETGEISPSLSSEDSGKFPRHLGHAKEMLA